MKIGRLSVMSLGLVIGGSLISGDAQAEKKAKVGAPAAACGLNYLPFTPGATWTYSFFAPAEAPLKSPLSPKDPPTLQIKVTAIKTEGAKTTISLTESFRKLAINTEIVCSKDGMQVSPQSYFFAGEAGGALGTTIEGLSRKDNTLEYPGKLEPSGLLQEMKAKLVRTPSDKSGAKLLSAALELERKIQISSVEDAESKLGTKKATRVELEITGRTVLEGEPADKAQAMPATKSVLWFAPGVGVVRSETASGQGWELSEFAPGA